MDPTKSRYETIWNAEDADREEFLSETDVESGHEQPWRCKEVPGEKWEEPRGRLATIKAYAWMINTSLLLVIVGLLAVLLWREPRHPRQVGTDFTASHRHHCEHATPSCPCQADPLTLTCHAVSTSVIKWGADEAFVPTTQAAWFSDSITEKWNTLMPGKK